MGDTIFFQGTLQGGIALAIQESKMVLAFVTDVSNEGQSWEEELQTNDTLKAPLANQAISLRLQAGSQEAGFLEALFPIPKKPTIVMIQNGTLKEYIQGGTAKQDLIRRVAAILSTATAAQSRSATTPATQASQLAPAPQAPALARNNSLDDLYDNYEIPARSSAPPPESSAQGQSLQEAKRKEAEKKAKEAKAKAEKEAQSKVEREGKGKERRNTNESIESQSSTHTPAERSYAEEVRQRKVHAAEERKRILKRIEDDKRERREREAEEKKARLLLSGAQEGEGATTQAAPIQLNRIPRAASGGDHCNLQVRLFNGSTIRSRFKSDATLNTEVRKWIDEDRTDGDAPYTFRVVLTPLPNKVIEPTEEIRSLLSLGLAPSATLVLVPAKYSSAYANSNGFVWRTFAYILGLFGAGYGLLASVLGGFTGAFGRRRDDEQEGIQLQNLAGARTASRIRGFQNEDDQRRDAQLYNGNSVSFSSVSYAEIYYKDANIL
ncbi:uncharacterized protein F4822DRAFT_391380 [Hypoxylon trugodes]|uniref:uncharacterized protein n=1 Tax=Hypoxylon trugodes TaxID=326681 RepID=UPI0021A10907|nr:uncharacterized protein F4822DRAFT_391380 [Hypoxylon trugodes]KAI1392557.1 hypothetical protein F4822DRAFT_391380 [Hypoxylon trugodes]